MIRQLTVSETTKALAHIEARRRVWNEHGSRLAACKIGEGIEVEVPEGTQMVCCCNGVRRNAQLRQIQIAVHMDRRMRTVVFKRIG